MEIKEEKTTEEIVVENEVVTEPEAQETIEPQVDEVASIEKEVSEEETEVNEWTPDFSFKVRDNQHEFDDTIKPLVTKDNQPVIKELYEKAFGLDYAKKRLDKYDTQFEEMSPKVERLEQYEQLVGNLDSMLAKEDFASFQKTLKISDDLILKRAIELIKAKEMTPVERQALEQQEQIRTETYSQQTVLQSQQQEIANMRHAERQRQVENVLNKPDIQAIASDFDAKAGQPGAFQERIWNYGKQVYQNEGTDLTPEQAVQGFLKFSGYQAPVGTTQTKAPEAAPAVPIAASSKETLPNISGSTKTPAKKVFKSLEDLRALAKTMPSG